ncbi:hypothetical protein CICLE_v10003712mg [Citrus x clementina]|uniref:Pentacotripeptide-repeat region of PRORP domain-containing protein n=1 Tax=Citrus clementina TaxID=85681 RepID=V4V5N4_CITCL|nr:hypothetical protein CICLE_v10003712mg [Citrus x clementina]
MLSLTLFSSQFSLFQQSSLLNIQPLQSPKHSSKTINSNYQKNPNDCRCFYRETTNSHTNFHKSSDDFSLQDNADAESSHAPSVSQSVDSNLLAIWLRSCNTVKQVKRIHAIVLNVYVKLGKLVQARKVFDKMSERNVVSWTAMVNGYSRFGFVDEAFMLFSESIRTGVRGNEKMFVCVMNLCGTRLDFELGRQIHASILKCHCRNLIVDSAILHFYAQFGDFSSAFCAFDGMSERDVVSWTAMITACSQQARGDEAIFMFSRMLSEGFLPNEFTVCSVLKACGEERALKLGRQLHAAIVKKLYKDDVFIRTSLVDMYAKCGEILDSRRVFDEMGNRNTVTWTSIISGYAREGLGEEAIGLFRASQVFDSMPERNLFTWKSMTVGYARNGLCQEALKLMYRMQAEGFEVDDYILMTVYNACGDIEWNAESLSGYCLQSS